MRFASEKRLGHSLLPILYASGGSVITQSGGTPTLPRRVLPSKADISWRKAEKGVLPHFQALVGHTALGAAIL
jgi:hypothetical protein